MQPAQMDTLGTSAASRLQDGSPRRRLLVVGGCLLALGTSSAAPAVPLADGYLLPLASSSGGSPWCAPEGQAGADFLGPGAGVESVQTALLELRRLSGLTWDQLARLFGVSRRSLHFWASGAAVSASHEEQVQRVLAVLRQVDRGTAAENRALMLQPSPDGALPFDDLAEGRFDMALAHMGAGAGVGRRSISATALSSEAQSARKPPAPDQLVDALHDRVHQGVHGARAVRALRVEK
jgi:transcriptional regulator with XRE-family HTH domain